MASYEGLNGDFAARLRQLVAASGGRVWIVSGYRTVERQKQLYDAAVRKARAKGLPASAARRWVAPPGKSNHNHGFAADLGGDLKWVKQNAARFGLNLPMGHEPWHVEPVGHRGSKDAHTTPPDGSETVAPPSQPQPTPHTPNEKPELIDYLSAIDNMFMAGATYGDS